MITTTVDLERLYENHKYLIKRTIRRNRSLLFALRLETEDVEQELSIAMLRAIGQFNPNRSSSLAVHIRCQLQYEILNMKRRYQPHGMTGIPRHDRVSFLYLDRPQPDHRAYAVPFRDDMSGMAVSELLDSLSETEAEAVDLTLRGCPLRKRAHTAAMDGVRRRCAELYAEEEAI